MFTEFIGTFVLMLAILLGGQPIYIAAGFLAAVVISDGGQLNPAVSLVKFVQGDMSTMQLGQNVAAQVAGALAAYFVAKTFLKKI